MALSDWLSRYPQATLADAKLALARANPDGLKGGKLVRPTAEVRSMALVLRDDHATELPELIEHLASRALAKRCCSAVAKTIMPRHEVSAWRWTGRYTAAEARAQWRALGSSEPPPQLTVNVRAILEEPEVAPL